MNRSKMNIEMPIIQLAEPSHAASLAKLAEKTFRDAFAQFIDKDNFEDYVARSFTENQIRSELLDRAATFFIARLEDKWVGYAKLYQSPPPDCIKQLPSVELARLYSRQQYLGRGIGTALVETCVNYALSRSFKSIWLGSWQENHRANAFYTKLRFEIFGTKTFAVGSDIQDDYIFARPIL